MVMNKVEKLSTLVTILGAIVHITLCGLFISNMSKYTDIFVIPTFALAMTVFAISTLRLEMGASKMYKFPLLALIGVSISLISMGFVYMMRDAWGETWKKTYAYFLISVPVFVGLVAVIIPTLCADGKCSKIMPRGRAGK